MIVVVVHDKDRDWQMFPEGEFAVGDGALVHYSHFATADPSLGEIVARLPRGFYAQRQSKGSDWQIGPESDLNKFS